MTPCPSAEELQRWNSGKLDATQAEMLDQHIETCGTCQARLDALSAPSLPHVAPTTVAGKMPEFLQRLAERDPASLASTVEHQSQPGTIGTQPLPQIPGYKVLRELGRGGMGIVYLARHEQLNRDAAIKVLAEHLTGDPLHLARFRNEAQLIARLKHPGIVQIYDIGEHAGRIYLALEYVEGGTLHDHYRGQPLPAEEAARLVEQVARAIHAAHQLGIVHRDLKPGNILLADGEPKVADFGLARALDGVDARTPSGAIMGTPRYMAPEQALGNTRALGPATDIYALGALLYDLLTGRPPIVGSSVVETLRLIVEMEPLPPRQLVPTVPAELQSLCLKCLRKNPAQRFPSAEALADELHRFRVHPAALSTATGADSTPRRWLLVLVGLVAALLVLVSTSRALLWNRPVTGSSPQSSSAAVDMLPVGSQWYGYFAWEPAAEGQMDGDVRLLIDSRDGSRFTGTYQTEHNQYEWKVAGTLDGNRIRWDFTAAVKDNTDQDVVGFAHVEGTLEGQVLRVRFLQGDTSAVMRLEHNSGD